METAANYYAQKIINLTSRSRGAYLITSEIMQAIGSEISNHTSASISINENFDPTVRKDMETTLNKIVPEGNFYQHDSEGPDDMPAHMKSTLVGVSLQIPIGGGKLLLGTWQGIYLLEHRTGKYQRNIVATVYGIK